MFEYSIQELADGMRLGRWTSRSLIEEALRRVAQRDQSGPCLNSIAEINPEALWIADGLDRELKEKGPRSLLHGLPVVVKDNICTAGMMHTTAGSAALADFYAPQDAEVVQRLKAAGAVILGKACLSEFAYWVARSRKMPSGFSSRSGQVVNPYDPELDPSGSSSGSAVAVAAELVPFSIGTETNGSLVSPARNNAVATIKPTVGLISRSGIIPISVMQDTAGPMGKSIADCAVVLDALWGRDPQDPATQGLSGAFSLCPGVKPWCSGIENRRFNL
ncbi:amidase family protein [Holdemania massiliensis]|uniref:amidase family protein n=1 Tax=Holdemania massiliensis TaxID=1468449 RepID=UPI0002DC1FE8|nr:amidase family protein [Holdemania massiliensis]